MFVSYVFIVIFFFKQKTAYEMRISDWSSDVCSSDLLAVRTPANHPLRVDGTLVLAGGALETPDGSIAAAQLGGRFRVDYRKPAGTTILALDGELRGGQFLYGPTYVVLPETPVPFALDEIRRASCRERWYQSVSLSFVAVSLQTK